MNRTIPLSLTLAVALASQVALGGCSKKQDIATPAGDSAASAAPSTYAASATPMDSMASAATGADAAASAGAMAASR